MNDQVKESKSVGTERLAYSMKEAANMIGVSVGHLYNESRRSKLSLTKSAKRTLILATELNRYLSELPESLVPSDPLTSNDR